MTPDVDEILIDIILFPDDWVCNSPADLQSRLNLLKLYCGRLGLAVITRKTEHMVVEA